MTQIVSHPLEIDSHPWGKAQINYIRGQFPHHEIELAANAVKPNFHVPNDTFIMVDKEGHHTLAQVPSSTANHNIFSANGTDGHALIDVLTQTRNFLKKHPLNKPHSFSDLRSLLKEWKNKPSA